MPSKDTYHEKHPETNAWMEGAEVSSGPARRTATGSPAHMRAASITAKRAVSGQVMRLARRLDTDPDELAQKIPSDTLRRTKYPVIEVVNEDGTRTFKHDRGIEEGARSEIRP